MKLKNPDYNKLEHKYEIIVTPDSTIQLVSEDDHDIPCITFRFKFISEINNFDKGCISGARVIFVLKQLKNICNKSS